MPLGSYHDILIMPCVRSWDFSDDDIIMFVKLELREIHYWLSTKSTGVSYCFIVMFILGSILPSWMALAFLTNDLTKRLPKCPQEMFAHISA